jgi:hypothetical protein
MARRFVIGVVAVLCVGTSLAAAAAKPWPAAHARLSYPVFQPTQTLGYKVSSFGYQPCGSAKSNDSVYATYGSYKGVLSGKVKGFGIFEGSPQICSDHAEYWPQGTRTVGGVKAQLGVYCDLPKHCSLSQGPTNGWILLWKRGGTRIQMDGVHLTLAQFLKVANSLKPVS